MPTCARREKAQNENTVNSEVSMSLKPVGVRLDPLELRKLDSIVEHLAHRNPDVRPTRSDALRFLLTNSGSVTGATVVAVTEPPRGRDRAA